MSAETEVLLPHAVLIVGAASCFAGGRIVRSVRVWGPLCLLTLAIAAALLGRVSPAQLEPLDSQLVQQSRLSVLLQWSGLAIGLFYTLVAIDASKSLHISANVFGALLLAICGVLLASVADGLWLMYAAVELTGVPACLMLFAGRDNLLASRSAQKHLSMMLLSSTVLLFGLVLIYGVTGSTHLSGIRETLSAAATAAAEQSSSATAAMEQHGPTRSPLGTAGLVMVLAALGYRLAAAPFHFGISDVLEGGTPWNAGVLVTVSQVTGFVVVIRVLIDGMVGYESTGQWVCLVLSATAMTVGSALALVQTNLRRLLAYLTVANGGFALIGVAVGFWNAASPNRGVLSTSSLPVGVEACWFFLGSSLLAVGGLAAVLVYLTRMNRQLDHVEDLAGLVSREPVAAVCGAVCLLNLAGVPPLPGFWGRLFVWGSALSVHLEPEGRHLPQSNPAFILLAIVSMACVLMTAAVCLRIVIVMLFEGQVARPEPARGQPALAAAVLATTLTLGAGLLPGPIVGLLHRAVTTPQRAAASTTSTATPLTPPEVRIVRVAEIETGIPALRAPRANPRP